MKGRGKHGTYSKVVELDLFIEIADNLKRSTLRVKFLPQFIGVLMSGLDFCIIKFQSLAL
jgi:hypothetical protein